MFGDLGCSEKRPLVLGNLPAPFQLQKFRVA